MASGECFLENGESYGGKSHRFPRGMARRAQGASRQGEADDPAARSTACRAPCAALGQDRSPYMFDAPDGKKTLADLFGPRSQLAVYHFMLTPGSNNICPGC